MALNGSQRGAIIHKLANLLEERVEFILEANQTDLAKASASGKWLTIYSLIVLVYVCYNILHLVSKIPKIPTTTSYLVWN